MKADEDVETSSFAVSLGDFGIVRERFRLGSHGFA